jgi:hypothetical protein
LSRGLGDVYKRQALAVARGRQRNLEGYALKKLGEE